MSAPSIPLAAMSSPARAKSQWIISKRDDITWFFGSASISYLVLVLMAAGAPVIPFQLVWFFGIDGPHVLSTVTRTYFDKTERAKLGRFLWILVPLMLVGPVMVWAGLNSLFMLLAVCWQHFHIVKQHFGFMMIYKAKVKDRDRTDFWLDRIFLLASLFVPLGWFILSTRPAITTAIPTLAWASKIALAAYIVLTTGWIVRQLLKMSGGAPVNWPKLALLATVVPLQWLALLHASHYGPDGILRAGIVLGLFHSFQYHRLMWFHNKNRYTEPGARERYGFAAHLVSGVGIYLAVAISLHFLTTFLPQMIFPYNQAVSAMVWGFAFTHYCLDSRIWHVRTDKGLASALRMG